MTFKEFYNTFAGTANQTFDVACLRENVQNTLSLPRCLMVSMILRRRK